MINEAPARTDRPDEQALPSAVDHEDVFRRWIDAYNDRNEEAEADARAPGYVAHAPGMPAPLDSEAWTQFIAVFSDGFPDLRLSVEDIVSNGDLVAARISFHGTHTREFLGIPPTNRQVAFASIELDRMVGGKVQEHWFQLDQLGLLRQLGMVVIPGPRLLLPMLVQLAKKLRPRFGAKR
jgi:predicted ester cyclase